MHLVEHGTIQDLRHLQQAAESNATTHCYLRYFFIVSWHFDNNFNTGGHTDEVTIGWEKMFDK